MTENKFHISRVTRSKEEAKTSYDKISRWYDFLSGHSEKKFRDAGFELLVVIFPLSSSLEVLSQMSFVLIYSVSAKTG